MVLRRSSKVNEKYLMSKSEYYVFCNMSNEQKLEYKSIIENKASNCLSSITQLQKVANCIPTRKDLNVKEFSSKYFVVQQLLNEIHSQGEKVGLFNVVCVVFPKHLYT